jgi:4-amino-4-deoxychorismate lyase
MLLGAAPAAPPGAGAAAIRAAGAGAGAGVTVRVCSTRLGVNPRLAGLKTLNRLESVLARMEWRDPRIWEGLMLDADGHLVCGTMTNVFVRRARTLHTPLLDRCGVAGVMRRWVMSQSAGLRLKVLECRMRLTDLADADEVFLTNAVAGVVTVGVLRIGRQRLRPPSVDGAERLRARLARV